MAWTTDAAQHHAQGSAGLVAQFTAANNPLVCLPVVPGPGCDRL